MLPLLSGRRRENMTRICMCVHVCACLCISAAPHVCRYTREPEHSLECHFSPGTPTLFSRDGVCQWPNVHQLRQVSHPGIKPTSDGARSVHHSARLLELVYLWCLLLLLCVCVRPCPCEFSAQILNPTGAGVIGRCEQTCRGTAN